MKFYRELLVMRGLKVVSSTSVPLLNAILYFVLKVNIIHQSEETVTCNTVGQFIAHEYECNQYYHCGAGFNPVLKTCANGSYFDINVNNCNHMSMVACTSSSPTIGESPIDSE